MARAIESERIFFRSGPVILAVWFFLIFQGYKALWISVVGPSVPALTTSIATSSAIAIYGFARFFEVLFTESLMTRSWIRAALTGFVGLILIVSSGLGVANALYATIAGGPVIENGIDKISARYDAFADETQVITRTPVLDDVKQRIKGPVDQLAAEIISPNCGIGSGAAQAISAIQRILGPTFVPLNFVHRAPACSDMPALQQMATQYRDYIQHQIDALPSVAEEHSGEKIALSAFLAKHNEMFTKQRSEALIAANDATRAIQFFGSRDNFNEPIRRLIALDQTFLKDRSDAVASARHFGAAYSPAVLEPTEIEQEKTLGSFQSLLLGISRFNPWYMVLFVVAAIGLDLLLITWFHHARTIAFLGRATKLVGVAGDRVRNLWLPPDDEREVRR